jgi:ABC-2 type transport system ATP-binding protein
MADNVVVIGKGKLIANTSIKELIAGNSRSNVFVRTANQATLESIFKKESFVYEKDSNGFKVSGVSTDKVGKLAFSANIPVLELASRDASLEEVFLELTEGSEEFQAHVATNKQGGKS